MGQDLEEKVEEMQVKKEGLELEDMKELGDGDELRMSQEPKSSNVSEIPKYDETPTQRFTRILGQGMIAVELVSYSWIGIYKFMETINNYREHLADNFGESCYWGLQLGVPSLLAFGASLLIIKGAAIFGKEIYKMGELKHQELYGNE